MRARPTLLNRNPARFEQAVRQWPSRDRVLVEGDSWFRYDSFFGGTNLFLEFQKKVGCVSLCMSANGDTVWNMLAKSNLDKIKKLLLLHCFDAILFSGGGNDLVNAIPKFVRPYTPGGLPNDAINQRALNIELSGIRLAYECLADLRDSHSPHTKLVTHNYGFPNLSKGGFRLAWITWAGPWIAPKLKKLGYSEPLKRQLIANEILSRFAGMLDGLRHRFRVAETASVLSPRNWRDEMHLTREGYRLAARPLVAAYRATR